MESLPKFEKLQKPHNQSFIMSERKKKLRFESVDATQRSSFKLKTTLIDCSSLSTNRRKILDFTKASNLLFKDRSQSGEHNSETRKSNSLASFYKEESKMPRFINKIFDTNNGEGNKRSLLHMRANVTQNK